MVAIVFLPIYLQCLTLKGHFLFFIFLNNVSTGFKRYTSGRSGYACYKLLHPYLLECCHYILSMIHKDKWP